MFTRPNRLLSLVIPLSILIPGFLLSQVKIKERVEIGPRPAISALRPLKELSAEDKTISVPRKGHLSITLENASNQYVPMTPAAFLEVIEGQRSDTIPVQQNFQSVSQYIPSYFEKFYFGCQAADTAFVMYFYGDPKDSTYTFGVDAGDRVIFRYHGEQVNPVDQLYRGGNSWSVTMRIRNPLSDQCVNPGNAVKFEYLQISVVLVDEIPLGGSKYYYLAGDDNDGWTLKDDWKAGMPEPSMKTEVTYDVQPVIAGDTIAVSWEERTPLPDDTTKSLPDGIIRVTGKFFHPENLQRNMAVLTATFMTSDGESYAYVNIEVVKNKQLKILEHAPWAVWPYLPPRKGAERPGYNPKRSFALQVLDDAGEPLKDEFVTIRTDFVPHSGGHIHNTPPLSRAFQGVFYGQGKSSNPLVNLKSDADGRITIDSLVASEIAGRYLVTAFLAADTTVRDTVNLQVKVPGLLLFNGSGKYKLTGKTDTHPDNHYFASQAAVESLIVASDAFAKKKWNTTGNMRLNDMSLEWGGLFDLDHRWSNGKGHDLHRVGKSVDIENLDILTIDTVSVYTGKDTVFSIPKVKWVENFQDFMENQMKSWRFVDEGQAVPDVFRRTSKFAHFEWKGN